MAYQDLLEHIKQLIGPPQFPTDIRTDRIPPFPQGPPNRIENPYPASPVMPGDAEQRKPNFLGQIAQGGGLSAQGFGPIVSNKNRLLRILVRNLAGGVNIAGRANLAETGQGNDRAAALAETRRYHDAQIGNMGADNTRSDAALKLANDKADFAEEKGRWAMAHGDDSAAKAWAALAETIRSHGANEGLRGQSLAITVRGQDETARHHRMTEKQAAESESRRAKLTTAMLKWPEIMKREYGSAIGNINQAYNKGDIDYDTKQSMLDSVYRDYELRDQSLGRTDFGGVDPYGNPMVQSGGSTTGGPKAPAKKGFQWPTFGKKAAPSADDPAGIR